MFFFFFPIQDAPYARELSRPLRVYYGYARLTKKIVRKPQLVVMFENSDSWNERKERYLKQKMTIVYVRHQTPDEAIDGAYSNRQWTKYGTYIDQKPFFGDIEAVLQNNFIADANNVSEDEREIIRDKMRAGYRQAYGYRPQITKSIIIPIKSNSKSKCSRICSLCWIVITRMMPVSCLVKCTGLKIGLMRSSVCITPSSVSNYK